MRPTKPMKILAVDDSNVYRTVIKKELSGQGFQVTEAKSGEEALEILPEVKPDLITLDVNMAEMNGYDTCEKIMDFCERAIPVVFITSDDTLEGRMRGFHSGGTDFLTKPFRPGSLTTTVNNILFPEKIYQGMKAVLVDDSPLIQRIIIAILDGLGLEVLCANDGEEAFELVKENRENIHILFSDFHMPKLNGDQLCLKIRQELGLKELPIIILSAQENLREILNIFEAGASDFLGKPFLKELFLARTKAFLNNSLLTKNLMGELKDLRKKHRNEVI